MPDSFADLWNSSVPSQPAPPPQKLGSAGSQPTQSWRPKQDAFTLLSSTGPSAPTSRSITPSKIGQSQPQRQMGSSNPPVKSTSGDAFSGLLAGSLGGSNGASNMTIAERAAKVERDRLAQMQKNQQAIKKQSSAWDGLDTLAAVKPASDFSSTRLHDDWDLGLTAPVNDAPTKASSQPIEDDDWGLGDFSTTNSSNNKSPSPAPPKQAIWDLDDFSSPSHRPSPPISHNTLPRTNSPGDFDFGNREDALIDDDSHNEDDILGVLSKPVTKHPSSSELGNRTTRSPPRARPDSKTDSPPPHVVGQIVQMGFSPQQARSALANTNNNVQAAIEMLLSNGGGSPSRPRLRGDELEPESRRLPPRVGSNSAAAPGRENLSRDTPSPSVSQQERNVQLQDQADKLLAQASEIGLSVFNRANAFWNSGKEKALKVYEERAKATASSGPPGLSTRPKWMQDVPEDLVSKEPAAYVSPFRRPRPQPTASSSSALPPAAPREPSPAPLIQRRTISASTSAIASSAKHKALGGEKFKLGQYGEAETAYTSAMSTLPSSHLLLVPLHNNRALTRLKTGDHTGAVEDATAVVELIGVYYKPGRVAEVTREDEGAGVDLGDGLIKAWKRRAEAYEGREKWEEAMKDWESVAGSEWVSGKIGEEAVRGAGRCRRMIMNNTDDVTVKPPNRPKPSVTLPTARGGPGPPSQALTNLRQANAAAEAEDQAQHELKDAVDARLIAWKGGKESNIRALLASLDTVLWPEVGWQKVGMAELVTPGQVKIRYTKAIAKLHPDKLNARNTTLEQRMIANGVFGSLNEAWNAFK